MPRLSRAVFFRIPHHITQRGNRRENVFFSDEDRTEYLNWLQSYCDKHDVDILAYCLMTNHVHMIAFPMTETGLRVAAGIQAVAYALCAESKSAARLEGACVAGAFFSSPLDDVYLWAAIRYVERNPVRARMVQKAEEYCWSSAAGHCGLKDDSLLSKKPDWKRQCEQITDWPPWLAAGDVPEALEVLRRNVGKGLPCGSERFVQGLEKMADRILQYRPRGRPRKEKG